MHAEIGRQHSGVAKWAIVGMLVLVASWLAFSTAAHAAETPGKRTALVIGNARYPQMALTNPENDARVMAATLRRLGFEVTEHVNLGVKQFRKVMRDYARQVESEEGASVFYYAGHGVQIEGRNYLLPVDVNLRDEYEIRDEGVDIEELFIGRLERTRGQTRIVILDACRDNPFTARTRAVRGAGGLAEMAARGALIAYATAPGATAEDGPPGTNSVFTRNLAKEMLAEGVEVEQMFKRVRVNVMRDTDQRQIPWVNTSMTNNFSFNPVLTDSHEETVRRADLARLQALLAQREQQQKDLETQLEQMSRQLAASREQTSQRTSAATARPIAAATRDEAAANVSVTPSPGAPIRPVPPSTVALVAPAAPPPTITIVRPSERVPAATPAVSVPIEPPLDVTARQAEPRRPALDTSAPGGMSSAAYKAALVWMAARARSNATSSPDLLPTLVPAPAQSAVAVPQLPRPVQNEPISTPIDRVALSRPVQRVGPDGGGSERCVALLIRAQLGEAIQPNELAYLKKECH